MKPIARVGAVLAVVAWAALWAWLLEEMAVRATQGPAEPVAVPDLDEIGARLYWSAERRRLMEELARRHQQVSEVACGQLAAVATARETWTEGR